MAVDLTVDEAESGLPEANVPKLLPEAASAHAQSLSGVPFPEVAHTQGDAGNPAQEYGTPKKRRVSGGNRTISSATMCECVADIHGVSDAKAVVSFEGFLVELGEVKQIADGKAGSRGGRKVLSLMLGDGGGMIQVNLWNDIVSKKQRSIEAAFQDSQAFPRIRATNFEVIVLGTCGGKRLAKVQSIKSSDIEVVGAGSVSIHPSLSWIVTDFNCLGEPYECVAVQGIISRIGEMKHSQAGCAMQSCILLSAEGIGLPLMLHGDKFVKDADLMKAGVEVLLYWITALPGLGRDDGNEEPSFWWLYQEHVMLQTGMRASLPSCRKILEVGGRTD